MKQLSISVDQVGSGPLSGDSSLGSVCFLLWYVVSKTQAPKFYDSYGILGASTHSYLDMSWNVLKNSTIICKWEIIYHALLIIQTGISKYLNNTCTIELRPLK